MMELRLKISTILTFCNFLKDRAIDNRPAKLSHAPLLIFKVL